MFQCDFITGGCNTVYEGFDFVGDLIAYPCSNQILIYNIRLVRTVCSLSSFEKRVNKVKFFRDYVIGVSGGCKFKLLEMVSSLFLIQLQ